MSNLQVIEKPKQKRAKNKKYDYSQGLPPVKINMSWCKGCNICIALCPQEVFDADRDGKPVLSQPDECLQCGICWMHCPDFAITSNYK